MPTRRSATALLAAAAIAVGGLTAAATAAQAAPGCKVEYKITNQWGGGYGADVTVTNLGDPVSSWNVGWTFTAGQKITQLWNGNATQSGSAVSVASLPYNGSLGTEREDELRVQRLLERVQPGAGLVHAERHHLHRHHADADADPHADGDPDAHPDGDRDPDADRDTHADTDPHADDASAAGGQLLRRPDHAGVPRVAVGGRLRQGAAREDRPDAAGVLGGQLGRRVARQGARSPTTPVARSPPARRRCSSSTRSPAATAALLRRRRRRERLRGLDRHRRVRHPGQART